MNVIPRRADAERLREALARSPVVVLVGPRQAGKSTLARSVVEPDPFDVYDLEDPRDVARLSEPILALQGRRETIVIDEAQRAPGLFPVLRVLVDDDRRPGRFLVLGSASPELVGLAAESLAGRVAVLELPGIGLGDVGGDALDRLWLRGGLPPSLLAADDELSAAWRDDYIATFLERDLAGLGFRVAATTMRRFWMMVAHVHGQTWSGADIARSLGVSQPAVRRYLDALTDALVLRQLQPWHESIAKRQVRAPKVYIRDTGLLHRLLGITHERELLGHPRLGASWEGLVIEGLLRRTERRDGWFWGTHGGAELDLLLVGPDGRRIGVEVKRTATPSVTRSMRIAIDDLRLDALVVVHAGDARFPLAERIEAVGAREALLAGVA